MIEKVGDLVVKEYILGEGNAYRADATLLRIVTQGEGIKWAIFFGRDECLNKNEVWKYISPRYKNAIPGSCLFDSTEEALAFWNKYRSSDSGNRWPW